MPRYLKPSVMNPRTRLFVIWATALSALWLAANRPRDAGTLKPFWEWAGCPWTFATWEWGRLTRFDPVALAVDLGVWVAMMGLAWVCARSRFRKAVTQQQDRTTLPV